MVGAKSLFSETRRIWLPGGKQSAPRFRNRRGTPGLPPAMAGGGSEAPENPPSALSFYTHPRFSLQKAAEGTAFGEVSCLQ